MRMGDQTPHVRGRQRLASDFCLLALSKTRLRRACRCATPTVLPPLLRFAKQSVGGAGGVGAPAPRHPRSQRGSFSTEHCLLTSVLCLLVAGCGYTTRPGLASYLKTVYVKPFTNQIDITQLTTGEEQRFPIYRHRMEIDLTNTVINRFQFTGLLRPASAEKADCRLEGDLVSFRRDALRYDASQQVEEWRLNVVANLRFYDQRTNALLWEEPNFTGDTTYFALGAKAESESQALDRAITDFARRVVERAVESW